MCKSPRVFLKEGEGFCACNRPFAGGPLKKILPIRKRKVGLLLESLDDLPNIRSFPALFLSQGYCGKRTVWLEEV